jgi:pyruvate/2-oxoglutarate dehydrogenase complex dihydrolipoamide dehydrogenase (E3) component
LHAAPDLARGEQLRTALEGSGADLFLDHKVWFVSPGVCVAAVGPKGPARFEAPAIVVATGTTERIIPVPGITLPGVIGLAAATILLKAPRGRAGGSDRGGGRRAAPLRGRGRASQGGR